MGCSSSKQVSSPCQQANAPGAAKAKDGISIADEALEEHDDEVSDLGPDTLLDLGGLSDIGEEGDDGMDPDSSLTKSSGLAGTVSAHAAGNPGSHADSNLGSSMGDSFQSGMGSGMGSVPLEKITRPRKKRLSRQASGHEGFNFIKQYAGVDDFKKGIPDFILKALDKEESNSYKELEASGDAVLGFIARSFGVVRGKDGTEFLKLDNLLKRFSRGPHVMDCKIGVRSFTEDEVNNKKLRDDLYTRMVAMDPSYPTKEERAAGACTKFRWMNFNDEYTTLRELGFRIDGIENSVSKGKVPKKDLHNARTMREIAQCIITNFMPRLGDGGGDATKEVELQLSVVYSIRTQLKDMIRQLGESTYVQTRSIVGSSLLFAVDQHGSQARVFWIDFAKVKRLPDGVRIDHRSDWSPGNHEDGIIRGVENMLRCFDEVDAILSAKMPEIALVV